MKSLLTLLGLSVFAAVVQGQNLPREPFSTTPAGRAVQESRGTNIPNRTETITPETREKLRATQEKYREEQKTLMEKLTKARSDLNAAIQADTFDEKTIREKSAAVAAIEADQSVLRAKQYQEMKAYLPKQRADILKPGTNSLESLRNTASRNSTRLQNVVTNRATAKPRPQASQPK